MNQHRLVMRICGRDGCCQTFMAREWELAHGKALFCGMTCRNLARYHQSQAHPTKFQAHPPVGQDENQFQAFERFVRSRGFVLTLSDFLKSEFSAEYRKYNCWLKQRLGWKYDKVLYPKEPGKNRYTYTPAERLKVAA